MLKLAGNCALIVVLVMLNSCLKRPEKRAPRLDLQSGSQPAVSGCASFAPAMRALHTKCRPDPDVPVIPEPNKMTKPEITVVKPEEDEEEEEVEIPDALENDRSLASISVAASCPDSHGCLYRNDGREYWLRCEIKAGGCNDGFAVEVRTATAAGSPQVTRGSVCEDGDKTIADLSQGKIKLECETDQKVMWSLASKKAELILRKSHLADRYLCVITLAGTSRVADFKDAGFSINTGDCPADDNRIRFNLQLEFSW